MDIRANVPETIADKMKHIMTRLVVMSVVTSIWLFHSSDQLSKSLLSTAITKSICARTPNLLEDREKLKMWSRGWDFW